MSRCFRSKVSFYLRAALMPCALASTLAWAQSAADIHSVSQCKPAVQPAGAAAIVTPADSKTLTSAGTGTAAPVASKPQASRAQPAKVADAPEFKALEEKLKSSQNSLDLVTREQKRISEYCESLEQKLTPATGQPVNVQSGTPAANPTAAPPSALDKLRDFPWLFPALSVIVSLLAIGYVLYIQKRADSLLAGAKKQISTLRGDLEEAELALEARKKAELTAAARYAEKSAFGRDSGSSAKPEQPANRGRAVRTDSTFREASPLDAGPRRPFSDEAAASTSPGVIRAAQPSETPEDTGRAVTSSAYPSERESKGIAPATPVRPAPIPVPSPDPRKSTGDIVADYNKARTLGDDGGDWFKENYSWIGLSCTNLNERHLDPNVVLLFQEENRGGFLGVLYKGEMRLVPALDKELEVSSSFLAGVFDYPPQTSGRLVLFRAATIEQNGSVYQLKQSGEIKLER